MLLVVIVKDGATLLERFELRMAFMDANTSVIIQMKKIHFLFKLTIVRMKVTKNDCSY